MSTRSQSRPATVALDQSLYQGLADFRLVLRRFLTSSEKLARSAGVTTQQYQALLVIRARSDSGVSLKQLADEMLLAPHGAVQLTNRMETQGLVSRRPSPTDGRSVLVSLTPKGTRSLRRLAKNHLAELMKQESLLANTLDRLSGLQRAVKRAGGKQ